MSERKPPHPAIALLTTDDSTASRVWLAAGLAAGYILLALPVMAGRIIDTPTVIASVLLGGMLVALSAIDAVSFRLPDVLTLPLTVLGLATTWWLDLDRVEYRAAAALIGYATLWLVSSLYVKFRHRQGLGLGDAKLFAAAGAWLGYEGMPGVLLWASLSALVVVILALGRSASPQTRLPFGPFIAFSIWVIWLYGTPFSGV